MEEITAKEAGAYSEAERQEFVRLVRQGGEVGDAVVERNVRDARCLVFHRIGSELVGIAALKIPQHSYRERIGRSSGTPMTATSFPFELGYVFVPEKHRGRGFSRRLVQEALAAASGSGVFATSRSDNPGMHVTLHNCGFRSVGKPYAGRDQLIQLFLREAP